MQCADVVYVDIPESERSTSFEVGHQAWNPKMGTAHILIRSVKCSDRYCGYCGGMIEHEYPICECGEFDVHDHHGWRIG